MPAERPECSPAVVNGPCQHVQGKVARVEAQGGVDLANGLLRLARERIEPGEASPHLRAVRVELDRLAIGGLSRGRLSHVDVHVSQELVNLG
jgi:hypothetical protein